MIPADHFDPQTGWLVVPACPHPQEPEAAPHGSPLDHVGAQLLDRPCDTACNYGCDMYGDHGPLACENGCCPDCDGTGRHTFTIEVEASGCEHRYTDHGGGNYTAWEKCRDCKAARDGYGMTPWVKRLRVHVAPGMVLPIYAKPSDGTEGEPKVTILGPTDQGRVLGLYWRNYPHDNPAEVITLPPTAAPGMWAAQLAIHTT